MDHFWIALMFFILGYIIGNCRNKVIEGFRHQRQAETRRDVWHHGSHHGGNRHQRQAEIRRGVRLHGSNHKESRDTGRRRSRRGH